MAAALLRLRPAEFDDWALLLDWVNQPDSLAAKLKTKRPIETETHKGWLRRFLDDRNGSIFILMLNEEPAGQVRFQPDTQGRFEIDVYVSPRRRGEGIARQALNLGMARVVEERGSTTFLAQVMAENNASHRLFLGLGFRECGCADGHRDYRLDLDRKTEEQVRLV